MIKVLWIEDNDEVYFGQRNTMEENGCTLTVVSHVEKFRRDYLEKLDNFDCVLLDILFDDSEYPDRYLGLKILEMIREVNQAIPIFIWTVVGEETKKHLTEIQRDDPNLEIFPRSRFTELLAHLKAFQG